MIPAEKSAAVSQGLRKVFDVTDYEDICLLSKDAGSAQVFRIVVRGTPFLLRVIMLVNAQTDPDRQFPCMTTAAEGGLAPRVLYANAEDGICITDFVETAPLSAAEAFALMPKLLRRLHALPSFPKELNFVTVDGSIQRFRAANFFAKSETDEIFSNYVQLSAVYPRCDPDMVSCHNDLKPENLLFDGQRAWLVGWKAAFVNDRYFDLAILANFLISSDTEERIFLQQYFEQPPDEYQLARFFLMRQIMHIFYAAFFLLFGSAGKPVDVSGDLPSFRDLHERIWKGEVDMTDNANKIAYGRVHWQRLLENTRQARFDDALRIVSGRNPESFRRLLSFAQ